MTRLVLVLIMMLSLVCGTAHAVSNQFSDSVQALDNVAFIAGTDSDFKLYYSSVANLFYITDSAGNLLLTIQDDGTTGTVTVGNTASGPNLDVKGAAANDRSVRFLTGANRRWAIKANNTAETGANAGSAFTICAYTDAGALIDTPISITRAAGGSIGLVRPLSSTTTINATGYKVSTVDLGMLHLADVNLAGLADQNILKWDAGTSKWIIATDQTGAGAVPDGTVNGQQLFWDNDTTDWLAFTPTGDIVTTKTGGMTLAADSVGADEISFLGLESLTAPAADRIAFYDKSANSFTWLIPGSHITITGTTIDTSGFVPNGTVNGDIPVWNNGTAQWNAVAMSGDATIGITGALAVADDSHNHILTNVDVFTEADLETQAGAVNLIVETEIDTGAELDAILTDATLADDDLSNNSIGDLTDVDLTGVADTKILKYDVGSATFIIAEDAIGSGTVPDGVNNGDIMAWNTVPGQWNDVVVSGDATIDEAGVLTIADNSHAHIITDVDVFSEAELETQAGAINVIVETEIDTGAELNAILTDATLADDDLSDNSIGDLDDVNTAGVADTKILKYDAGTSKFIIADDEVGAGTVPSGVQDGNVMAWNTVPGQWDAVIVSGDATMDETGDLQVSGLVDADVADDLTIASTHDISTTLNYLVLDDKLIKFGTDLDIQVGYDETTDDRLEFHDGTNLLAWLADAGTKGNFGITNDLSVGGQVVWSNVLHIQTDVLSAMESLAVEDPDNNLLFGISDAGTTGNAILTGALDVDGVVTLGSGSTVISGATGLLLGSAVDVAGTTAETAIGAADSLLIRDDSASANREITIPNLLHVWETIELTPGGALAPAANAAEYSVWTTAGNANLVPTLRFDTTTSESTQWGNIILPADYVAESTLRVYAMWTIRTGGGANKTVNLEVSGVARSNDDPVDVATGASTELNDTWIADGDVHTTAVGTLTLDGTPQPLDVVTIKCLRDVANDDLAGDCDLLGLYLEYQTKKEVVE